MSVTMSLEGQAEALRMCMAEAGYPDALVRVDGPNTVLTWRTEAEALAAWRAGEIVASQSGDLNKCWPCWRRESSPYVSDSAIACTNRLNVERFVPILNPDAFDGPCGGER